MVTNILVILTKRLVKQGADINLQDRRGHSPRDLALGFLQKELDGFYSFVF